MASIEARVFQIPCVKLDGELVSFPFKRVDALFYYLVCQKTTTRQELVDLLWADCSEETGYKNLRHTIYTLRKILGGDLILTTPKTEVRLNPERELVSDFDRPELRRTADIGQFLQGFTVKNAPNFNAWVDQVRERMSTRALSGLSAGAADALARGQLAEAERLSLEYLDRDGLDEKMVMFLMRLYRQDGRYYKAATLYQRLKGKLAEELGIAPLHETAELYYDIVNQWNQTAAEDGERALSRLTGSRGALLEKMRSRYQRFLEGYPAASLLFYGEAGCGKSYLLQHFLRGTDFSGQLVLTGSCSQREAGGYLEAWKNVMLAVAEEVLRRDLQLPEPTRRTIARVFPVFSDGEEGRREPCEFAQNRCGALVADAVALLLALTADGRKLLLVFEDLQWMDAASQDLLCQVLRCLGGSQLLLLAASRTLNVDVNFLADEALLERVFVPCLTEEETGSFLAAALGAEITPALRDKLYEATAGNPRLLADAAENLRGKDLNEAAPPDPNAILRQRLSGLSEKALHLADILALSPDRTPCGLLSAVTGFSSEELYPLSVELEEHSLIREECIDGESCLGFLYPHMRDALYEAQSYFQRQPLHLQIADYLEAHLQGAEGCSRLAYHCREGGDHLRAFHWDVTALVCYARQHYEIPPLIRPGAETASPLPEGITAEKFEQELEQTYLSLGRQFPHHPELDRLGRLLHSVRAERLIYTGQYQEGLALTEQLIRALSPSPREHACDLCRVLRLRIAYGLQTDQASTDDILWGMELAQQAGKPEQAYFLLLRGVDLCKRGEYESSDFFLSRALDQLDRPQARHPAFFAYVLAWRGEGRRRQRNFTAACKLYQEAEEASSGLGFWPGCAFLRTCWGRAALALGDDGQARRLFSEALDAYAHTGELPGRGLAQAYSARYAARDRLYGQAAALLSASRESASLQSSLAEQGVRDSVLAQLRRDLDQSGETDNDLHRYLYRPLDLYCHRGMQRLRGAQGAYEYEQLEECLRYGLRQAKPLTVQNLYSKNKNFMTE